MEIRLSNLELKYLWNILTKCKTILSCGLSELMNSIHEKIEFKKSLLELLREPLYMSRWLERTHLPE